MRGYLAREISVLGTHGGFYIGFTSTLAWTAEGGNKLGPGCQVQSVRGGSGCLLTMKLFHSMICSDQWRLCTEVMTLAAFCSREARKKR
jgi:hypothetical protein